MIRALACLPNAGCRLRIRELLDKLLDGLLVLILNRMEVRIHAPPDEVLSRIRANTAKRSMFNFSLFGDRPTFHGEVHESSFTLEWIPRFGVLTGPSLSGTITTVDAETIVQARLRPTLRVLATGVILLMVFPLSVEFLLTDWVGPGVFGVLICSAVGGMNVYVGVSALSSLRRILADLPGYRLIVGD